MDSRLEGKYALITGASEGLGKNMVVECAQRGMHIIAVALPTPSLDAITELIKRNFDCHVIPIGADLTSEEGCKEVYDTVKEMGIRITFLINCAGASLTQPFHETPIDRCKTVLRLNTLATTMMTRYFIDDLRVNAPSFLLNVSSLSSYFFLPNKQIYGASKAYVYAFSRNLQTEYRKSGISITVLCPGGLNSNIRSVLANNKAGAIGRESITSPEFVAKSAIEGCLKGKEVVIPGKINKIFLFVNRLLPKSIRAAITTAQMNKLKEKKKTVEAV